MSSQKHLLHLACVISVTAALARAQCPVNTVMVRGHVDHPQPNSKVQVQLVYPKPEPGESAQANLDDNTFHIPIEFLTQSSKPLFKNLHAKCDRKPTTVVITLLTGDQQSDQVTLDLLKDFDHLDASAYTLRHEITLNAPH